MLSVALEIKFTCICTPLDPFMMQLIIIVVFFDMMDDFQKALSVLAAQRESSNNKYKKFKRRHVCSIIILRIAVLLKASVNIGESNKVENTFP